MEALLKECLLELARDLYDEKVCGTATGAIAYYLARQDVHDVILPQLAAKLLAKGVRLPAQKE